ncbi:diphosphomevalonate decarboxylase [Weeksellaceae bacterium KMM 9724]|uniref:diphosphomevalonate/mevalonate 3,5-bisphosphate decarboxylase family protein n=1 Tax=Profundicola chukchiensis TaxID=2961959 RepID=UPI002439A4B5|nr:diphosphomevalonate decarboxylase [Profundicola chukchiensis]MDG4949497.1 diphosphomevalonate decarboxylase [Profundicola chukchiensis]
MLAKDFIVQKSEFDLNKSGKVSAKSLSNIALVKYWGKTDPQIPTNPSISYTLTNSYTETTLSFEPKKANESEIRVFLDEVEKTDFVPKIKKFFQRIAEYAPYLEDYDFTLHTHNSFPHSSGIASSASGMSALSKCLIQMEVELGYKAKNQLQRSSFLSRLGSGSACRSVYPGLVTWGESEYIEGSSDLFAIPLEKDIHPVFKAFNDTILLIHEGTKSVSSTVGHQLMNNHPYAQLRFNEAKQNIKKLLEILKSGDLEAFGKLVEHEALSLHAMMMLSDPAFILMKPNTVSALDKLWEFRKETGLPLFFTLDAGANIHLLYPDEGKEKIEAFIQSNLLPLCQNEGIIYDRANFEVL